MLAVNDSRLPKLPDLARQGFLSDLEGFWLTYWINGLRFQRTNRGGYSELN